MNSKRSVLQLCASLSHDICRSLPLPIMQEMSTGQFKLFSLTSMPFGVSTMLVAMLHLSRAVE